MNISIKTIDRFYVIFVLALATNPFFSILATGDAAREGSPLTRTAWTLVYSITVLRLIVRRRQIIPVLSDNIPLVLLVVLTLGSALWSIDPSQTLHHGIGLCFTSLIALDLSLRYSISQQLRMAAMALGLMMFASVLVETIFAGIIPPGNDAEGNAWHGVYAFKNEFGRVVVFTTAIFLSRSSRSRWVKYVVVLVALALAGLSRSAGALIILALIVTVFVGSSMLRWRPRTRKISIFASSATVAILAYLMNQNFEAFTSLFGKDPHLTGRSVLWTLAIRSIQQRPLLGYGYAAFWGNSMQIAMRIREAANWDAPHSHNGYIDLMLGIGVVGLAILLLNYFILIKRAFLFIGRESSSEGKWPILCVCFLIAYQIAESSNVAPNSLVWIVFCMTMFSTSQALRSLPVEGRRVVFGQKVAVR